MQWFWLMVWVKIFVVSEADRSDGGSNISADVEPQPPGNNNHCQGQKNASISMGDVAFLLRLIKGYLILILSIKEYFIGVR